MVMTSDGASRGSGSRWTTAAHAGVVGALLAGLAAAWAVLALTAAILVTPVETMQMLDRQGAWGIRGALRQGSALLVTALRPETQGVR